MGDTKILFDYFQLVWSDEDIKQLRNLFSEDIILSRRRKIKEKHVKETETHGIDNVIAEFDDWAKDTQRAKTKILEFSLQRSKTDLRKVYTCVYEIVQEHKDQKYIMKFGDAIELNEEGKIKHIMMSVVHFFSV